MCAIIADRQDNTIRFVVDTDGDTKILSKKHWLTSIRLANPDEACCSGTRSNNSKWSKKACNMKINKQKKEKKDWMVQQKKEKNQISISIRKNKQASTLKVDALQQ